MWAWGTERTERWKKDEVKGVVGVKRGEEGLQGLLEEGSTTEIDEHWKQGDFKEGWGAGMRKLLSRQSESRGVN